MLLTAILGSRSYRIAVVGNQIFTEDFLEDGVYTVVGMLHSQEYVIGSFEVREGAVGAFSDADSLQQEPNRRRVLLHFTNMLEELIERLYAGFTWIEGGEIESAWCVLITAYIVALRESIPILETLLTANTSLHTLQRHGYSNDGEICQDIARMERLIALWNNTFA